LRHRIFHEFQLLWNKDDTVAAAAVVVVVINIQTLQRRASERNFFFQRIAMEKKFPKDCRGNFFPKGFDQ
jgi:hypothetical protein